MIPIGKHVNRRKHGNSKHSSTAVTWCLGEGELSRLAGHGLGGVVQQALMRLQGQHYTWP